MVYVYLRQYFKGEAGYLNGAYVMRKTDTAVGQREKRVHKPGVQPDQGLPVCFRKNNAVSHVTYVQRLVLVHL